MNELRSGAAAIACLALFTAAGCATMQQKAREMSENLRIQQQYPREVADAMKAMKKSPTDPARVRAVVDALANAGNWLQASEYGAQLLELDPDYPGKHELMGKLQFNAGHFEQSARHHFEVLRQKPEDPEAFQGLMHSLLMCGHNSPVLDELASGPEVDEMLVQMIRASLQSAFDSQRPLADVRPEGQVITSRLTDFFTIPVEVNGHVARLGLAFGYDRVVVSEDFATTSGIQKGRSSPEDPRPAFVFDVRVGEATIAGVKVEVSADFDADRTASGMDGLIGSDILRGYSLVADRRQGEVRFYPPGTPPPAPPENTWSRPYYLGFGGLLVEFEVVNRARNMSSWIPLFINPGWAYSTMDLDYTRMLDLGDVITTDTNVMLSTQGYGRTVQIRNSGFAVGGIRLRFDALRATSMDLGEPFIPYGVAGRDVLCFFRITIDADQQMVYLEPYPEVGTSASGWMLVKE